MSMKVHKDWIWCYLKWLTVGKLVGNCREIRILKAGNRFSLKSYGLHRIKGAGKNHQRGWEAVRTLQQGRRESESELTRRC